MELIPITDIVQLLKIQRLGFLGKIAGIAVMQSLGLNRINQLYAKLDGKEGIAFCDTLLHHLNIRYTLPDKDLKRIPAHGPFVLIANHPLGGIDGILMLRTLLQKRPDAKIMANFLLQKVEPLRPHIIAVNPFETRKEVFQSSRGIRETLVHLKNGHALGIFPAGEVSTHKEGAIYMDKPWEPTILRLLQKARVPIIPLYFHTQNSKSFYLLSSYYHMFRTALLPRQLLSQHKRPITLRIGNPILPESFSKFETLAETEKFLRAKVYMLSHSLVPAKYRLRLNPSLKVRKKPKAIVRASQSEQIHTELEYCRTHNLRLFRNNNYEVFLAQKKDIPVIMREIGRLREITFREVGEGTNRPIDLDSYDTYYHHMFLWDNRSSQLIGAYRMGLGNYIYEHYGIRGFYLQSLFRFEPELFPILKQSIEMGRAFIVKDHQAKPWPLFMLWKGIVHTALRHSEHKYLIGGVSISPTYSDFSKSLMIEFMKSHYYDPFIAQYVRPRKEYKVRLKDEDKDFVFNTSASDLRAFDKIIDELDPSPIRIPVLIRKYLKQNAKVVAFNVDPLFNNAVDGLMYIRIADLPEETVKPVMEELQTLLDSGEIDPPSPVTNL